MKFKNAKKLSKILNVLNYVLEFTKIGLWIYILVMVIKLYNKVG